MPKKISIEIKKNKKWQKDNLKILLNKYYFIDKFEKLSNISLQMSNISISPSKADKYSIKIAKDGILRSSTQILTQKGVDMNKIREMIFKR